MPNASSLFAPVVIDTEVVDDPDAVAPHRRMFAPTRPPAIAAGSQPIPTIALGRVSTEELTMHVFVDGCYHRRIPTLSHTSCATELHSEFASARPGPRREELRHPLCRRGCFTPFELRIADELAARELAAATVDRPLTTKKEEDR